MNRKRLLFFLLAIIGLSTASRTLFISRASGLAFDEAYYVNASRVILGWQPTNTYTDAPAYTDPNSEHPQLGKLIIAGNMRIFGDDPWGWRMGSIEFGALAMLGMYLLVRAARASPHLALGVLGVMALDNLIDVHSRIGTLDIFAVTFMIFAAVFFVRRKPILAGLMVGIGATVKLVVPFILLSFLIYEIVQYMFDRRWYRYLRKLKIFLITLLISVVAYLAVLSVLDMAVKPYDPGNHRTYNNAISHTRHMVDVASKITSPNGPQGIASYPWQWLQNKKSIEYYSVRTNKPLVAFRAQINPFLIFAAIPALFLAIGQAWRDGKKIDILAAAWFMGTFIPLLYLSVINHRTSYVFYMVIVLPSIYIACARLFSKQYLPRSARIGWAIALLWGFLTLYPIRTI